MELKNIRGDNKFESDKTYFLQKSVVFKVGIELLEPGQGPVIMATLSENDVRGLQSIISDKSIGTFYPSRFLREGQLS